MKRFYTSATVEAVGRGYTVYLDSRPIRTPGKQPLVLDHASVAEAVAEEWAGQGETIQPDTMPLTQLANTVIDGIRPARRRVIEEVARFAETDVVCYRTDSPKELAARQEALWNPLVTWVRDQHGVRLSVTQGILPVAQTEDGCERIVGALDAMDDWRLASAQCVAGATASAVIALALVEQRLDATQAFEAALAEELYQAEVWGQDREAMARRARIRADIEASERLVRLVAGA